MSVGWEILTLSFAAGTAIGLAYFGLLWLTVRRIPSARHPGRLVLVSLALRLALALALFYLVMAGRWERMLAALVGFLLMRQILMRRLGPRRQPDSTPVSKASAWVPNPKR